MAIDSHAGLNPLREALDNVLIVHQDLGSRRARMQPRPLRDRDAQSPVDQACGAIGVLDLEAGAVALPV